MDLLMTKLTMSSVFNLSKKDMNYLSIFGESRGGLLDIVSYKPNIDISKNPYYVTEHVDPGLFSLNIYSDASGMQFYDNVDKKWFELKMGYGVIFCGQAAKTLLDFTLALHRVMNNGIGRFSVWYEVGIKSQLQLKEKIKKISDIKKESDFENKNENMEIEVEMETFYYGDKIKKIKLPVNVTVFDLKKEMEIYNLPPPSKIIRREVKTPIKLSIVNEDDIKIGKNRKWKLTSSGYLIPINNEITKVDKLGVSMIPRDKKSYFSYALGKNPYSERPYSERPYSVEKKMFFVGAYNNFSDSFMHI